MNTPLVSLSAALLLTACIDPDVVDGGPVDYEVDGTAVPAGWRAPSGPCALDPVDPSRLLIATTDFSTGALSVLDLATATIQPDVAPGSTDAIPFAHGGRAVIVHRHGIDRIDVWEPEGWSLAAQHALGDEATRPNPHAVAFDSQDRAWVTTFAQPELRVLRLDAPSSQAEVARVDLSAWADDDGNPEASQIVACGDLLLVTAQHLDPGFARAGPEQLIVVDPATETPLDLDPSTPQADGLPLLGQWVRQLRRDPADASGRTLLALDTGIERIDLRTGIRTFAVDPTAMEAADIGQPLQLQSFDVDDGGQRAYLAAYTPDFDQVRLYVVGLDGHEPAIPEPFAEGFDSVERTLEVVGDRLWYGSTRQGQPGLWRFALSPDSGALPTTELGPISTGLPPYSLVTLP